MRKLPSNQRFFLFNLLIFAAFSLHAQSDSLSLPVDSINISSKVDTVLAPADEPIEEIIYYPATDSTVYDIAEQRVRMYNKAKVTYGSITLEADYIEYDFVNGLVYAHGVTDTSGATIGKPIFTEGGQAFTMDTMKYNFETKKGVIKGVRTDDGESYVHAEIAKKQDNDHVHNYGGKYTTCSNENPHYHFRFKKMVVIPDDKIITGPAYMKVGKVPLPLGIPFGFFPNTTKQKQGILVPGYGFSEGRGYFLIDGGYYVPINEYWDTKLTGDIYSRGSWGLRNISRYNKKYRYSGSADIQFNKTLNGEPELDGFNKVKSFFVTWRHTQDGKARPGTTFSASVEAGTSNNFSNNYNSSLNDYVRNQFSSAITYGRTFESSSFSLSARHNQNTQSGTFNVTLPQLSYNRNRFFIPLSFLTADAIKGKKLDQKIGVTYSSNFRNTLNTNESELRFDNLADLARDEMVNGVQHTVNVNSSLKLGYFTLNPRLGINHRWHFKKEQRSFDFDSLQTITEDVNGFFATSDWNFSTDLQTKIYGTVTSKKGKIEAVRHVMTPSFGYSLAPEFNFNESYIDTVSVLDYNPFVASAYNQSNTVRRSALTFGLQNSLEMKVRTNSDSTDTSKKLKLIENYRISTSYNLAAEEFQLANINMNARTTLFKNVSLQWNGVFDPYDSDSVGTRINELRWNNGSPFLRGTSNVFSLSTNFSGGEGKKTNPADANFTSTDEIEEVENNPSRFENFNIPWNLSLSYSYNISKQYLNNDAGGRIDTTLIRQHGILFNGGFKVMDRWKISFTSGYDVKNEEFTPTNITLYWDLHCWQLTGNVVPFGVRKSYNLSLGIKASVLQDLKVQRRGTFDSGNELLY